MLRKADVVITVCGHADEHCPAIPAHVPKLHWPVDDPAVLSGRAPEEVLAAFRQARDELESRVRKFLSMLSKGKVD
jgi:arsenate reductase